MLEEFLQGRWTELSPLLQPALDREGNLFSLDDVWQAVQEGKAQFWPGRTSALVTEIKVYPRGKVLNVWLAGGVLDEIRNIVPFIRSFGSEKGCTKIALTGRKGWAKVLGMKPASIVLYDTL